MQNKIKNFNSNRTKCGQAHSYRIEKANFPKNKKHNLSKILTVLNYKLSFVHDHFAQVKDSNIFHKDKRESKQFKSRNKAILNCLQSMEVTQFKFWILILWKTWSLQAFYTLAVKLGALIFFFSFQCLLSFTLARMYNNLFLYNQCHCNIEKKRKKE